MKHINKYLYNVCFVCIFIQAIACFAFEEKSSKAETFIESLSTSSPCSTRTKEGDILVSHYEGYFIQNGTYYSIDSTYERQQAFNFKLSSEKIMAGFSDGFYSMCPGEKRRIFIPPELAFGESGISGIIPPNSALFFEIELVDILPPDTKAPHIE